VLRLRRQCCALQEIASDILTEQTPKKLLQVRGKVYELLVNVVPPELIIRQLATELMKKLDDEVKHEVCHVEARRGQHCNSVA